MIENLIRQLSWEYKWGEKGDGVKKYIKKQNAREEVLKIKKSYKSAYFSLECSLQVLFSLWYVIKVIWFIIGVPFF